MEFILDEPERAGMSSARLARISPAMQGLVERGMVAGASMLAVRRGHVVYCDQVGQQDLESGKPMQADTIFRIYSMTKPIICTALMTLFEEGRFLLETPVAAFLPDFAGVKVLDVDGQGNQAEAELRRPITVADLMRHTAGLTYDFLLDSPVCELYRQAALLTDASRSLESLVRELARLPLAFQPGTRWHYSVGIDVAAHLIEVLADRPLREVLQERIFAPLSMDETGFAVPDSQRSRLAAMYGVGDIAAPGTTLLRMFEAWQAGIWQRIDADATYPPDSVASFARGGHGLFSTIRDYARFALMLLNNGELDGNRILGRKTLELMHANHLAPELLPWELAGVARPGYGFGLGSRTLMDVGATGLLGSAGEFGWAGAASTYYWVDPREELVGVFMTQYQGVDEPDKIYRNLIYQAIVD